MLWFENLTVADPTYALPLIAVGTSYSALEFGFTNPDERLNDPNKGGRLSLTIKDVFQTILLMSVPFVTQLPAGIFAYWIPSSVAGMAQTSGTRWLTEKERKGEKEFTTTATTDIDDDRRPRPENKRSYEWRAQNGDCDIKLKL